MMIDQIRIGRISTINPKKGTASVVYKDRDDSVTDEFPLLATEYMMPKIDDLVLVLHLKSTQTGVIIGPIYNDKNRPVHSGKDVYYKDLKNGAYLLQKDGKLLAYAKNADFECKNEMNIKADHVSVKSQNAVKVSAGDVECKSKGTITIDASNVIFKCSSGSISLASIISHIGG